MAGKREKTFLDFAFFEIAEMADNLELVEPENVKEKAKMLYRKAREKRLTICQSKTGIISAALYIACRQCEDPRTFAEIAKVSKIPLREITRLYSLLLREMEIKLDPADPAHYVPHFCSILGLSRKTDSKAVEIIKKAKEQELTIGSSSVTTAVSSIYIAAILNGEHRTQKEISDATGVSERAIHVGCAKLSDIDLSLLI